MPKIRTLSRTFLKGHKKQGLPTYFVEKFILSRMCMGMPLSELKQYDSLVSPDAIAELPKHHTIRMGRHFKSHDELTIAVWSDKPYRSKQIKLWTGPIKTVDIEIIVLAQNQPIFQIEDKDVFPIDISIIASNDGLAVDDFIAWFNLPIGIHQAQILIWNPKINY